MRNQRTILLIIAGLVLAAGVALTGCEKPAPSTPETAELALAVAIRTEHGPQGATLAPEYFHGRGGVRFRLVLRSKQEGFCYVFNRGTSGGAALLLPNRAWQLTDNLIKPGKEICLPPNDREEDWLSLDEQAGSEKLSIFFARKRIGKLEQLLNEDSPTAQRIESVLADMTSTSALGSAVKKEVGREETTFTLKEAGEDGVLRADVELRHDA